MWPRKALQELLGIEHPILLSPMAGAGTPALAAAVSNAGGLGGLGCGTSKPETVREAVDRLRAATNRAFNLNFFVHAAPVPDPTIDARARALVAPFYSECGLGEPPLASAAPYPPFDAAMLDVVLDLRPPVVSFHFGVPHPAAIEALHAQGSVLLGSATTVEEARALEAAGIDVVIAQGFEAGGHRGAFGVVGEDVGIGAMALVTQIVDAVRVPVVAAGGIADGRGVAAAFALGAAGVQMGTAFLACPEAAISLAHRRAIAEGRETRLSRAFTGQACRMARNRYTDALAGEDLPAYPSMIAFSDPLKTAGNEDMAYWLYGQGAALARPLPAADLMARLVEEAAALLPRARP